MIAARDLFLVFTFASGHPMDDAGIDACWATLDPAAQRGWTAVAAAVNLAILSEVQRATDKIKETR